MPKGEGKMRKMLAVSVVLFIGLLLPLRASNTIQFFQPVAQAQEYLPDQPFSEEQLDNLLAPIALYPDPLLAQVLLAATFVDQIDEAARWMRAYNNSAAIDDQPWDVSVKAVAHYPSVLYMMSDQIDWTTALGQAYVYQSTDVMNSVQHLRSLAYSAGNLSTTPEQEVVAEGDYIEVVPAQPEYIYVPAYDSAVIYVEPAYFYPVPIIIFGPPLLIGVWLNHDCDWRGHRIFYHGWRGGGWIARSRPHIHITNVYVNNNYTNIRINRNIVRRYVNYSNLNRFSSVHREVRYDNLARARGEGPVNPNLGNKIIRRNLDVTDPRIDTYRGHLPAEQRPEREEKRPPAGVLPRPAPQREAPRVVRPAPQLPPPQIERPPRTVFGAGRGDFDPRAASQRGQASRMPAIQPRPVAPRPSPPAGRAGTPAGGRRP
jgi:hypothetical protein